MKISRKSIIISFVLLIISLLLMTQISRESILHDILTTLFTGSFITLMLEISIYKRIKNKNYRILFDSLLALKTNLLILNSKVEKYLSGSNYIYDNFYEVNMALINNSIDELKKFDFDYYLKKENPLLIITNIINRKNVLNYYITSYSISYNNLRINLSMNDLKANLLKKELKALLKYSKKYIKTIDNVVPLLLNKNQYMEWIIKNKEIKIIPYK